MDVRRASQRFVTEADGRTTRHSFSFGAHYDPDNVGFGALIAHNDELLPPGTGYPDHPHRDTEIVTFVLSGALRHTDSTGRTGVLSSGQVQRLSAGSGVVHSEFSEAPGDTRFVQAWVRPDEAGLVPSYDEVSGVADGPMVPLVGAGGLGINASGAGFFSSVLAADESVALPAFPQLHVFVASGSVGFDELVLEADDVVRLVGEGGRVVTAGPTGSRLLVWAFR